MAKGKSTWKYNKLLTARRNYFATGSSLKTPVDPGSFYAGKSSLGRPGGDVLGDLDKTIVTNGASQANIVGGIGGATSVLASQIGSMINNINSNDIKSMKKARLAQVNQAQLGLQPDSYDFDQLIADYGNTATLSNVTKKDFGAKSGGLIFGEGLLEGLRGSVAGFGAGASFGAYGGPLGGMRRDSNKYMGGGPIGAIIGGVVGTGTSLIGNLIRNHNAQRAADEVNQQIAYTNAFNQRSLDNRADNLVKGQMSNLLSNYSAFGGPIDNWDGAIGYQFMTDWLDSKQTAAESKGRADNMMLPNVSTFADGGNIHIKPSKKGTFTAAATKHGMGVQEFARKVLANKEDYSTAMVKKANFAKNAAKWHHAFGGELNTHGADFTNGLLAIDNGGSHEENPFEGVPMGVDQEGTPNLVEEGETIFNDYVFSKRLKVPKAIRKKYNLRGTKSLNFADASKQLAKESEERPNDPISQIGMQALMSDLANAQEELKAERNQSIFATGGKVNKYSGLQPYSNFIQLPENTDFYTPEYMGFWNYMNDPANAEDAARWLDRINRAEFGTIGGNTLTLADAQRLAHDFKLGPVHNAYKAAAALYLKENSTPELPIKDYHYVKTGNGKVEKLPDEAIFFEDTKNGYSWDDLWGSKYKRANNGKYEEEVNYGTDGTPMSISRYHYYDPIEAATEKAKNHYVRIKQSDGTYGDPILFDEAKQQGLLENYIAGATGKEGEDDLTYYDPVSGYKKGRYADWLRYAPAVGFGIGSITDALGLTNKPDYANADAIIEATRNAGTYQPVKFNPIGNYLTYKPFDRDYYINKLNASAGATRRNIMDTSGGNRGTAMAGLLAADKNYLEGIGSLARQAEEYNLAQRQQVEDFNRSTNITNSQGMLQADIANQKALADLRELALKGLMTGYGMREQARQASDAARSANLSGLFQTLGDIGYEEKNARMLDNLIAHGYVPGGQGFTWRGHGGSIRKRRKGLTV